MHDDLQRLGTEAAAALAGLSARQTQATPPTRPEKWSIQQIAEHLLQTYRATAPAIQARIDKRTPTRAAPSLPQRAGQFLLITLGRFPPGRQAPAAVSPSLPATLRSGDDLAQRIHTEMLNLDRIMAEAEGMFGKRRAASHMILGPLSMEQWRRFHLIHGRHHLKQIIAIRKEHGF